MRFNQISPEAVRLPSIKTKEEILLMREAGQIVYEILDELERMALPELPIVELAHRAKEMTLKRGAIPIFEGYRNYPNPICISINDQVAHAIPQPKRKLKTGDVLKLDFGVSYQGLCADSARTVLINTDNNQGLAMATRDALWYAIELSRPGNRIGDLGAVIQATADTYGFGVVRELTGHGIGRNLHEPPAILNYGTTLTGLELRPGMTIAIEPMFNAGRGDIRILEDGWTVITVDGYASAHWEHTILITNGDPEVLTLPKN